MSTTAEKIVSEALRLPNAVRAFVAEKLIESLDSSSVESLSPAWQKEVEKRCREVDENLVELVSDSESFARAHSRLS